MTFIDTKSGHRRRLRERFLAGGFSGFCDHEIIELLLTLGTPRTDCKERAKALLRKFRTVRGVIEAEPSELMRVKGIGPKNTFGVRLAGKIAERLVGESVAAKSKIRTSGEMYGYLKVAMRGLKKEVFKVVFLDIRSNILEVEDMFEGTVDASAVYPREIIKQAILHNATGLIAVHNHPGGNPVPSQNDKDVTKHIMMAAGIMGIAVVDHMIIGDDRYFSFADEGLIEKYEAMIRHY